jgi:hypothetical protein
MVWTRLQYSPFSEDIHAIQSQWRAFASNSPEYPSGMFHAKGIVILAGGLTYMVPAWVNLRMLRLTGPRST